MICTDMAWSVHVAGLDHVTSTKSHKAKAAHSITGVLYASMYSMSSVLFAQLIVDS